MVRKLLFFLVLLIAANSIAFAQSGALKGKVIDKNTKEPIPFANIIVENNGTQAGGGTSDFDGNYTIKPIAPGKYDVKASFVGYKPVLIKGFLVRSDKMEFLDIAMESSIEQLDVVEVIDYKVPLISKDNTTQGGTVTAEEIAKMPSRNASSVATSVGGVFSRDGEVGSVRGQREDGNVMYIDGIRVRGSQSLPESAIEQVSVILGGVPAQYGDATGGIINVTTKGPSRVFGAGLELQTSQFLDPFGAHRGGLNFTGPLLRNKTTKEALIGYFVAADFNYHKDGATLPLGMYKVKDDILAQLEAHPLRVSTSAAGGTVPNANYIRKSDLVKLKSTQNSDGYDVNASGKLDIKASKNTNVTLGGSYNMYAGKNYSYFSSIFNSDRNSYSNGDTWRVFGRLTQRFPSAKDSKSAIKNVYISLQGDYTSITGKTQDADFKDNLFAYGNVGKFNTYKMKFYDYREDTTSKTVFQTFRGDGDTLVTFERSEYNPIIANYTSDYFDLFPNPFFREQIYAGGGMLNGYSPNSVLNGVYGIFGAPGNQQSGYGMSNTTQISSTFNLSADIKNHEIKFGLVFEKVTSGGYSYAPTSFWPIMYLRTNSHIIQLDQEKPIYTTLGDTTIGGEAYSIKRVDYNRLVDSDNQAQFDRSLRKAMGLAEGGTDWIDIDSYDLNSHTISYYDKDLVRRTVTLDRPLSVDFFSPDELLNSSLDNSIGTARGFDYYGNKFAANDKPSVMDFFTEKDANGNFTRRVAPFEPIYMAGYIQDKFSFDDLVFNVGVRVDRFDANQPVLKDPFSLYPVRSVGEDSKFTHPANIGSDYKIYVDNIENPNYVKGYRNGSAWYDAEGALVVDPEKSSIVTETGLVPYFVEQDKDKRIISSESFSDYKPQVSVMPRISFSFPISDEALFYAHYDVITQRPKSNVTFNPVNILFWASESNPTMSNPNLKPEKNVNYELGFQQKLSNSSSMNISAFYIESRDQIQSLRYTGAYPKTYYSYGNIDFGTVKGLTVSYDMRRTGNTRVRANYTLQFANGTGSNAETSSALIRSGQPNLRNLIPLDFDRRHAIVLNLDFRYSEGVDYNGPIFKGKQILKNAGFNITMNGGSGTPYTRSSKIYPIFQNQRIIQGSLNGSRLPWSFRLDGRFDKDFTLAAGKDANGNKKEYFLNVYLQVLNILNSRNIMGVYAATGNPDDDGYLAAAEYQTQIKSQLDTQAYMDLYRIAVNSPYNYSSPRMIRIGLGLNF